MVIGDLIRVHGLIELAHRRIDGEATEQALHAEGARLIRNNRDHTRPQFLVSRQLLDHPDHRHGGGDLSLARPLEMPLEEGKIGYRQRLGFGPANREIASQLLTTLA